MHFVFIELFLFGLTIFLSVFLRDAEIMQQKQKKANDPKPADEKAK